MTLINCSDLVMGYEGKEVLNGVNFTINTSDYICIVGENGSGKSTLIKGLLRLKNPDSGSITYENGLKNNDIGFMPQQHELIDDFPASVEEVVLSGRINSMGFRPFYNFEDKKTADDKMKLLNIYEIRKNRFADLSGGQKQRVLLARALCSTKKILVLDEPTAGLDPQITKELYDLIDIVNKRDEITIIMVSHDIGCAVSKANKIIHLDNDAYFYGSTDEYLSSDIGKRFLKGRDK